MEWTGRNRWVAGIGVVAVVGLTLVAGAAALGGSDDGDDDSGDEAGRGGDDPAIVQPGAPGEPSEELSDDEAAAITPPEHTAADTAFMQDMIVHHQLALEMAALVEERTERDDLPLLAERITVAQEAEIELLEEWLTDHDEQVPEGEPDHDQHASMPGMATEAELADLEQAQGPAFDRRFLELMIAHHQGAVTMVEQLYADGGGLEPAADRVARDVEADQNIEIRRMLDLLATLPQTSP